MTVPYNEHAENLVVALDFEDRSPIVQIQKTVDMAEQLAPLGVVLKLNSVLRVEGYSIIEKIHSMGAKVFADLKLNDIPNTLEREALLISGYEPEFVTVMCSTGVSGMRVFARRLEHEQVSQNMNRTHVVGVTVLTSFQRRECQYVYNRSTRKAIAHFAEMAKHAGVRSLVLSPIDLQYVNQMISFTGAFSFLVPGIRLQDDKLHRDDQRRLSTPKQAFKNGADKIIVGRSIIQSENPVATTQQYLDIIAQTLGT